jgi:hypothetical protein
LRRLPAVISGILVCALLAGCAPQASLFPLFKGNDNVFEPEILGEWIVHGGTEQIKPDDKSGTAIFEKSQDGVSYTLTIPNFDDDAHGEKFISTARLIRLGTILFIDLGSPDLDHTQNATIRYPSIEGHVFDRVFLEQDRMHIDFLSDKWVADQAKAGKLALPSIASGNQLVLSATTEDLRKFVLAHAEDKEAFSEAFAFKRKK